MANSGHEQMGPFADIICAEALRREIQVKTIIPEWGLFELHLGERRIRCRESLSELTSGLAVALCDDKVVTRRVAQDAGLNVTNQHDASDTAKVLDLLESGIELVVKPSRSEQGKGVAVGLRTLSDFRVAVAKAKEYPGIPLVEERVKGQDLRLVVIGSDVVAAAIRQPATICGDGASTVRELIRARNIERGAETQGESQIPIDSETLRFMEAEGSSMDSVLQLGRTLALRGAANLHTGGTMHDVTEEVHSDLIQVALRVAEVIGIPVVGVDLMVRSHREASYTFIEANERPGLANHAPQPTAARFVDLLFPHTKGF